MAGTPKKIDASNISRDSLGGSSIAVTEKLICGNCALILLSLFGSQSCATEGRAAIWKSALGFKLRSAREASANLSKASVNADASGEPVEYGQSWFSGETVTLTIAGDTA